MANTFENVDVNFATSICTGPVPRWKRKAMEAQQARALSNNTNQVDRFIPDRAAMDLDVCKYNMGESQFDSVAQSPSKTGFQQSMKSNLFSESDSKILAFKQQPPRPKEGFQAEHHVLYTQNKENNARKVKKTLRHIPQTPERILDAPELKQDFYLNLLEWSSQNIIAVGLAETVYLWNAGSGTISELCTLPDENSYISSVSWVADGSYLAVGTSENEVMLWDIASERKVRTMYSHEGRVAAMAWNQHILSSGSSTGSIYNHDVRVQQHHVQTLNNHVQEVCGLKWSPDGKYLASGGNDNIVNVWNGNGEVHKSLTAHTAAVKALAWCPWQSNVLATGGGTADMSIRFWNVNSGVQLNRIDAKSQVSSLIWNKEHKEIISGHGYSQNQLSIWSYPKLNKVTDLTGHTERILAMSASPDGSTIVSAAEDETLRFWKCFETDSLSKKKSKTTTSSRSKLTTTLR